MTGQTQYPLYAQPAMGLGCKDQGNAHTVKGKELFRASKRRQRSDKGQRRERKPTVEQQALAKVELEAAREVLIAARLQDDDADYANKLLCYVTKLGQWERMTR